jgi:TfoX/Sxy family transcriptional regulator of competence genes
MAYDEGLADRVRHTVASLTDVAEIKMFGGLCFTLRGNMFAGIVGDELMVRVDPNRHDELVSRAHARPMDFTGRPMKGFLYISATGIRDARALQRWIGTTLEYVEPMPPKKSRSRTKSRIASRARAR